MSDTNCCCSACQYSTPPWWVTMGFIPPYGYQGPNGGGGTVAHTPSNPSAGTPSTGTGGTGTVAQPQQPSQSNNPLGSILGGVLGPIGGILGSLGL